MRKIYIDAGSNRGKVSMAFMLDGNMDFEYFLFEPLPKFANVPDKIRTRCPGVQLTYSNAAVSTVDGETTFHVSTRSDYGSTLLSEKRSSMHRDRQVTITVPTIDFSAFIMNNFSKDDEIICKMDIEGGEWMVLPKMIADGSILYCNKLIVEFHHKNKFGNKDIKVGGKRISQHFIEIQEYCTANSIELEIWH